MIWLVLILGLILRMVSLNQSFWLDEATSATVVKNLDFVGILTKFAPTDFHPPFYYLLLKVWVIPFGISEVSLRMLSVAFGLATIWVVYLIGKKLVNKNLGLIAAILMATAPLHIYYSQEARMYSLQTFLVSLCFYFYLELFKNKNFLYWMFFGLTLSLIGTTDYLPLLIIPVFWIHGAVSKQKLSWFSKLALSHLPLAIFFAWWSPYFTSQVKGGLSVSPAWANTLGHSNLKNLLLVPIKFAIGRISFESNFVYAAIILIMFCLFGFLFFKAHKLIKKNILIWLWLLVPVSLAFLIGLRVSVFNYFRLIFVLPAFYILAAVGLIKVKENAFPLVFLALVSANVVFSCKYLLTPKFHREDWRGLVSTGQPVIFPGESQREVYEHYNGKVIEVEDIGGQESIWLLRYAWDVSDPQDRTRKQIESLGYNMTSEKDFNGIIVWEYRK